MSIKIQEALSACCQGLKEFAISAATWMGKTVTALGSAIAGIAKKVAEFVKPYFQNLKTFAKEHRQPIIIAAVAFAVGAIATVIVNNVFCKAKNSDDSASLTSATSSSVTV